MVNLGKVKGKTTLLLCVLTTMFSLSRNFVSPVRCESVQEGVIDINGYVISLGGVDGHGVTIVGVVALTTVTGLAIRWKRNSKKGSETR